MDNLTKEQRRKNMQRIKAKDTSIEVKLRKTLWNKGYRYRKNYGGSFPIGYTVCSQFKKQLILQFLLFFLLKFYIPYCFFNHPHT